MKKEYFIKISLIRFQIIYSFHNNQVKINEINIVSEIKKEEITPNPVIQELIDNLIKALEGKKTQIPNYYFDFGNLTEKEIKVLKTLRKIPCGKTISYSELGEKAGLKKNSSRFVGNVMAKNPFPIIFPCHRVIKKSGKIGNYTGGIEIKKYLLKIENSSFKL